MRVFSMVPFAYIALLFNVFEKHKVHGPFISNSNYREVKGTRRSCQLLDQS
jgi:hypothetical protein